MFFFISALGTLLHFVYEWSGKVRILGYISGVNESTWEHMKLMFVPMLIYGLFILIKYHQNIPSAFPAFAISSLIAIFMIPVFYYTYLGVLGFQVSFLNIMIFYICAFIGSHCFYKISRKADLSSFNIALIIIHIIIAIMFIAFTYAPPNLGIFISPV